MIIRDQGDFIEFEIRIRGRNCPQQRTRHAGCFRLGNSRTDQKITAVFEITKVNSQWPAISDGCSQSFLSPASVRDPDASCPAQTNATIELIDAREFHVSCQTFGNDVDVATNRCGQGAERGLLRSIVTNHIDTRLRQISKLARQSKITETLYGRSSWTYRFHNRPKYTRGKSVLRTKPVLPGIFVFICHAGGSGGEHHRTRRERVVFADQVLQCRTSLRRSPDRQRSHAMLRVACR